MYVYCQISIGSLFRLVPFQEKKVQHLPYLRQLVQVDVIGQWWQALQQIAAQNSLLLHNELLQAPTDVRMRRFLFQDFLFLS